MFPRFPGPIPWWLALHRVNLKLGLALEQFLTLAHGCSRNVPTLALIRTVYKHARQERCDEWIALSASYPVWLQLHSVASLHGMRQRARASGTKQRETGYVVQF